MKTKNKNRKAEMYAVIEQWKGSGKSQQSICKDKLISLTISLFANGVAITDAEKGHNLKLISSIVEVNVENQIAITKTKTRHVRVFYIYSTASFFPNE